MPPVTNRLFKRVPQVLCVTFFWMPEPEREFEEVAAVVNSIDEPVTLSRISL